MNANRHGLAERRPDEVRARDAEVVFRGFDQDVRGRRRRGRPSTRSGIRSGALLLACVPAAVAATASAARAAQVTDRGTFLITVDGLEAGEEEFLIQRSPSGARAQGTVTMRDGRKVITLLELTGPALRLSTYRASATARDSPGDTSSVFVAARADGALDARLTGPWGEEVREYRTRASTVVLDDGLAHHYFVLATAISGGPAGALHLVAPLARSEEDAVNVDVAPETIRVDGESLEATRVRLGAGDAARSAWFDGGGRLVRVAVPALGFVAQRAGGG